VSTQIQSEISALRRDLRRFEAREREARARLDEAGGGEAHELQVELAGEALAKAQAELSALLEVGTASEEMNAAARSWAQEQTNKLHPVYLEKRAQLEQHLRVLAVLRSELYKLAQEVTALGVITAPRPVSVFAEIGGLGIEWYPSA